ncbi:MAG: hypothetical protein V1807_01525 [Patescibacteria group bacterium]
MAITLDDLIDAVCSRDKRLSLAEIAAVKAEFGFLALKLGQVMIASGQADIKFSRERED